MRSRLLLLLPVLVLVASTVAGASESAGIHHERYHYRWHLSRFLGFVAGLFFPSEGDGLLIFEPLPSGNLKSELLVTSESSRLGEYWRYGSELNPQTGRTLRAWSSYSWRGETSEKSGKVETDKAIDIASGIYLLRQDPPTKPRSLEIWSDGKIYPVVVVPLGLEDRKLAGRQVEARHLSIRGVEKPGERHWKGKLDIWLATDPEATPLEIRIERRGAGLHLELADLPAGS